MILLRTLAFIVLVVFTNTFAESYTQNETITTRLEKNRPKESLTPSFLESVLDSNYLIGPGDFFDLFIEGSLITVQVSPEGTIGIEGVGVVTVAGDRLPIARAKLQTELGRRFNPKECFVQLSQMKRFRVPIYGAVRVSGQFPVDAALRLSVLLRITEGTFPTADLSRIQLYRASDTIIVDLENALRTGKPEDDPILKQGDRVYVPFRKVDAGSVKIEQGYEESYWNLRSGWTIADYLLSGGTYARDRIPDRVRVLDVSRNVIIEGSYAHVASYSPTSPVIINIPSPDISGRKRVYVAGMVGQIGAVDYVPGYTPMDYVAAAGVTPYSANLDRIEVVRYSTAKRESIDPVNGVVFPGDVLELPRSNYDRVKDFTVFVATLLGVLSSSLIIYQAYH